MTSARCLAGRHCRARRSRRALLARAGRWRRHLLVRRDRAGPWTVVGPARSARRRGRRQRAAAGGGGHVPGPDTGQCLGDRGRLPHVGGRRTPGGGRRRLGVGVLLRDGSLAGRESRWARHRCGERRHGDLCGFLIPGALLVVLGTVLQCIGLFRARVVPAWVPLASALHGPHPRRPRRRCARAPTPASRWPWARSHWATSPGIEWPARGGDGNAELPWHPMVPPSYRRIHTRSTVPPAGLEPAT